jgi:methylmalonyl-CoA carboxyltransferase large subunit
MKDAELRRALDEIRAALGELAVRVAAIEERSALTAKSPAAAVAEPPAAAAPAAPAVADELVLVIAAAVAAFLGERAHVRQIRLISSSAWAQQGRVSVQASHRLAR